MTSTIRVAIGTRVIYDGDPAQIVELQAAEAGVKVVLRQRNDRLIHLTLRELLNSGRARLVPEGPGPASDDPWDTAGVVLAELTEPEQLIMRQRAAHIREVLTGFRSGSGQVPAGGEPRPNFDPRLPQLMRYRSKADELGMSARTIRDWVTRFRRDGHAGLAPRSHGLLRYPFGKVDSRWVDTALEVMVEHTDVSRPSRTMVIKRTNARTIARYGVDVVRQPSRATAFRVLEELERRHPTFRLSTKRTADEKQLTKTINRYGRVDLVCATLDRVPAIPDRGEPTRAIRVPDT
jgi:hypothetical protein